MGDNMGQQRRNESIDRRIADLARRQHGVFARRQVVERFVTERQIAHRVHAGRWTTVLPSVYRIAGGAYTGRLGAMASVLWAGDGSVLSHAAAAMLWGFDGVRSPKPEVWVPVPRSPRSREVVVHRGPPLDLLDIAGLATIPITTPTRTLIDVSGRLEDEPLLTLLEQLLKRGLVTERSVAERLASLRGSGRPGTGRLASLLHERPSGAAAMESRLEVRFWSWVVRAGLPLPVRQHWVVGAERRYRLDFAWPDRKVAVECEGRAFHDAATAEADDRRRGDLASLDWLVLPVTWRQLSTESTAIRARIERALRRATRDSLRRP